MQKSFALGGAGAQTMPAVPKNLPRVMGTPLHVGDVYTMPSTPKTAPTPFYPTTPSKSRPAKTPVTVAAFRKRRSQLAASAFKECGSLCWLDRSAHTLSVPTLSCHHVG